MIEFYIKQAMELFAEGRTQMFWPGLMGIEHYRELQLAASEERLGRTLNSNKVTLLNRVINTLGAGAVSGRVVIHRSSKLIEKRSAEDKAAPFRRVL